MQIVIELSDLDYKWITLRKGDETLYPLTLTIYEAIKNGTPLEPHGDLINRQAVMHCIDAYSSMIIRPLELKDYIDKLPPVNPQEPCDTCRHYENGCHWLPPVNPQTKTGHWIDNPVRKNLCNCSECNGLNNVYSAFCPNCGAKMVEPQKRSE